MVNLNGPMQTSFGHRNPNPTSAETQNIGTATATRRYEYHSGQSLIKSVKVGGRPNLVTTPLGSVMFGVFRKAGSPSPSVAAPTTAAVPFSTFDGWLKYMRSQELDELQGIGMEASFARFYSDSATNVTLSGATDRARGFSDDSPGDRETPFRFRRFAGGRNFPAGRYYAVAHSDFGWDGGTLVAELSSYVDPAKSGPVHVVDLADPLHAAVTVRFRSENPRFYRHALAVMFEHRDGWASPYFQALKSAKGLRFGPVFAYGGNQDDIVTIYFPLHVDRTRIEKVIDLRRPEVRAWMAREIFTGIKTIRYLYAETYTVKDRANWLREMAAFATPALHVDEMAERAAAASEQPTAVFSAPTRLRFYAAQATMAEARLTDPVLEQAREAVMLRFFTTATEGGSPITEAVGQWLRGLGANALIYPSARMNAGVKVENGEITEFAGFNLVDYRDAPKPDHLVLIVQRPVSYLEFNHLRYAVSGPPPTKPQLAGSFIIRGLAEHQVEVRDCLEKAAQQEASRQTTPPLQPKFPESTRRRVFRLADGTVASVSELRLHAAKGKVALLDNVVSTETNQTGEVGGWLLSLLRDRAGDRFSQTINWGGDWFCYCAPAAGSPCTFEVICPICETTTRWNPEEAPPPARCEHCGFSQPPYGTEDETRERFLRFHQGKLA